MFFFCSLRRIVDNTIERIKRRRTCHLHFHLKCFIYKIFFKKNYLLYSCFLFRMWFRRNFAITQRSIVPLTKTAYKLLIKCQCIFFFQNFNCSGLLITVICILCFKIHLYNILPVIFILITYLYIYSRVLIMLFSLQLFNYKCWILSILINVIIYLFFLQLLGQFWLQRCSSITIIITIKRL